MSYYSQTGPSLHRRRQERTAIAFVAGLAIFSIWFLIPQRYARLTASVPCQLLPGANDAVVIMKTGVTELEDRLPVHLDTTLTCPPNYVIFSDHEELYRGKWKIRDVLANVNHTIQQNNEDFEIYRHVKEVGREGLEAADLTGQRSTSKTTKEQKVQIAGWVLDKWKFLPMINETFHLYPDHKWYVFIETDTYLFWSTTLKYLSTLDSSLPLVLGHRSTVKSEFPFMHGGSGYIVSNAALRLAAEYINANSERLNAFVEAEWAGDIALGVVFKDAGIPLTAAWPMYQPHFFGVIDFGVAYEGKAFWCTPAGSFHHMTPEAIEDIWNYEQDWMNGEDVISDPYTFIRHGDVFNDFLLPRLRFARYDWDNQCSKVNENVDSIDDCKNLCVEDDNCLQYLFDTNALQCRTLDSVRFGEAATGSGLYSDWIFERVERWRDNLPPCHGMSFPRPEVAAETGQE